MKTKLICLADQEAILQEIDRSAIPKMQDVEALAVRQLTEGRISFAEEESKKPVCGGNRVTIRISSNLPKYNREKVTMMVGKGLYDSVVETQLLGMKVGESGQATVKGEPACFTVLKIERMVIPEPTDEMAQAKGIEGIQTVEQYKAYILSEKQDQVIRTIVDQLLTRLTAASQFSLDEDDVENAVRLQYEVVRSRFLQGGSDLDTMPDEEWKQNFYSPEKKSYYEQIYPFFAKLCLSENRQAYLDVLTPDAVKSIQRAVVLCQILEKKDADAFDPTLKADAELALIEEYFTVIKKELVVEE